MTLPADRLGAIVCELEDRLNAMPNPYPFRHAFNLAEVDLTLWLMALGARKASTGGAELAVLDLGGIRSTSTGGLTGACRNWITAARKRLETEIPGAVPGL